MASKLKAKHWYIIIIVAFSLVITFFKEDIVDQVVGNFTEADGEKAILAIKAKYGVEMARTVEKIMRLETAHFKSGQYKKTGSAGMEVGKWKDLPKELISTQTVKMEDADKSDGIDEFIVWKSPTSFAIYLAEYIKRYNGNWARWNTTNAEKQRKYAAIVNSIKTKFV